MNPKKPPRTKNAEQERSPDADDRRDRDGGKELLRFDVGVLALLGSGADRALVPDRRQHHLLRADGATAFGARHLGLDVGVERTLRHGGPLREREPSEFILADDSRPAERPIVAVICSAGIPGVASRAATDSGTRSSVQPTPDTNGLSDGGDVIPLRSRARRRPAGSCDLALMRDVVAAGPNAADPATARPGDPRRDHRMARAEQRHIALLDVSPEGGRKLVPTASSGPQSRCCVTCPRSTWTRATRPRSCSPSRSRTTSPTCTARAAPTSRRSAPRRASRWADGGRSSATKSYAVLPLCAGPRPIGVMTLQWPDSREFDDHTTEMLETVASIAAVSLDRSMSLGGLSRQPEPPRRRSGGDDCSGPVPCRRGRFAGRRARSGAHAGRPAAARGHSGRRADAAVARRDRRAPTRSSHSRSRSPTPRASFGTHPAPIRASSPCSLRRSRMPRPPRRCANASCRPSGSARGRTCRSSQTLSLLNGVVVASTTAGIAVPAWLGWIDGRTGALTHCGAGDTDVVVHSSDGRTWSPQLTARPLGTSGQVACDQDIRLLLPGDRVMVRLGDAELRVSKP